MKKRGLFVLLIAFIILLIFTFAFFVRAEDSESSSDWLMYRKYLNHTAWDGNTFTKVKGLNHANYTLAEGGSFVWSSPAVANGYVYMGAGSGGTQIVQLNASNISQLIASFPSGTYSGPSVANGYVYIGGGSSVYQLNASNISVQVANFTTGGSVRATPTVANGFVYVGSYDNSTYQLNASNVSMHIANFTTGGYIRGSAAVANGYVYIGSVDNQTYQLNASNISQLIANFSMSGIGISSPAVANGYVYTADYNGKLYQLNASNISQQIFNYSGPLYFQSSPAVANGYVYIGTWNGYLYQMNASNISQRIAFYYVGGSVYSSPAVANGFVYVGSLTNNKTFQLNASNVSIQVANFSAGGYVYSSPAYANDYVYIGSDGAYLYQLNADNISQEDDFFAPDINFTSPTPANDTTQLDNSIYVNVSTYDVNQHSAWIDWNRSLKGWWNFEWINSTNGTIYDNSSYNRHARLINATSNITVSGKRGQGLDFDGMTYYVNLGAPLSSPSEWTYSVWFYPRSNGTSISALTGQVNNPALRWGGALNRVYLFLAWSESPGYKQIGSSDISLNQWHHAVGIVNLSDSSNQSMALYIDGVRVNFASWATGTIYKPSGTHYINIRDSARSFNGTIDEVMIFSRALTPQEINASYNANLYKLYRNFSNLSDATYTYKAYAIDALGDVNVTEENTITINSTVVNCTNLGTAGKTYLLDSDIINNENTDVCINVTAQNITLDCRGHLISSIQNISGIFSSQKNTTIQNCNMDIGGWNKSNVNAIGIYFYYTAREGSILNNTVNATYGIYLNYYANGNTVANNTVYGGPLGRAIYLNLASSNNLTSNNASTSGGYSLLVEQNSNYNILKDNIATSNSLLGIRIGVTIGNILINNTGISRISGGIYLLGARNNTFINNTAISNMSYALRLDSSSNNTFINNTAISNAGDYGAGLVITSISGYPISRNNTFINNTITSNSTRVIHLLNTTDNDFYNQITVGYLSGSQAIYYNNYAVNNTFSDCVNISSGGLDVNLSANSTGNIFINCSYNMSKELVDPDSELIRKWYYSAYANDTNENAVSNANVTAYNSTNDYQFNLTTSETGYTPTTEIIDYVNDGGTRIYYSNYTIYAVGSYYPTSSHYWNATLEENTMDIFTLTADSVFPDINFTFPTPADNSFQSATSVYINVSTYDANNYSAFIDWERSLIGWWAMDFYNSSGVYDNSTYNNFGDFNGNLTVSKLINAIKGEGLEFDGSGDYLQLSNEANFDFTDNFTIEAWVKPRGSDTYNALITKFSATAGWDWILQTGRIRLSARGTSSIDSTAQGNDLRDGNWHHIVAVINKTNIQQYIDGSPLTLVSGTWTPTTNDIVPSIGYRGGITNFNGTMDEVKIYSRALGFEEVRASYDTGTYRLYHNFTNLQDAEYTYKAYAIDIAGNVNATEERTVIVDTINPDINFTSPTPENDSTQPVDSVYVNASTYDANNHSAFIDWNRSLIGWWSFENVLANGIIYDNSSYENNGQMVDFTLNTTILGKRGNALAFDGIDDFVNFDYNQNFNITDKMTVEAWFYHASNAYYNPVVSRDDASRRSWNIRTTTAEIMSFVIWNQSSSAATATKTFTNVVGTWHHLAAVYNSTAVVIYVDGVPGTPANLSGNIKDTNIPLNIGNGAGTNPYWNGSIDEVRIHSRALSPEEINASYNAGLYKLYNNFTNLSDGTYTYKAYAIDVAGKVNTTEEKTITIDTTPPDVSITYPTNNTAYSNTNLDVNYTVSDSGTGVESCWYSNDSYEVNTSLADCGTNITTITWNEGEHSVTIWVNDTMGNINFSYVAFTIDTINPDINFTSPTPENDSRQPTNSVYVNVSTYDANNHSAFIDWNRSLIGWWAMDFYNSSGIYDNSTNENFGTFVGLSVSRISGAIRGEGLEFDGKGDYLRIANEENFDFTGNFTIEVWIKPRGSDTYNAVMGKYLLSPLSGWDWILDVGRVRMSVRGTNSIASSPQGNDLRDGNWHHIAAVMTNRSIQQYVDGVPLTKVMGNWTPVANSVNLTIGYRDSGMTGFNGSMDEVKIFSRALTAEEINASYNAGIYRLYNNFTNLSDATYTYRAYAIDAAGNVNVTEGRTITIDTPNPPNVILNSPENGTQSGNETQIFNCSATDVNYNTQLSNVTFYWNYSGIFSANTTITVNDESATLNFTMAGLTDKTIIWNCYACDNLGNCAFATSNYTLTIDTTTPLINFTNITVTTTNAVINWTTSKNANSLVFYGTNPGNLSLNVTNLSFSTTHTITVASLLPTITYYYNISSCDDANHCNTSGTYNFTTNATRIYYIDATNGLDSNNGTSQSSAWKTISKVNSENFNPGDSIMFKRNETWREQLIVPSSGSAGSPIIFADYGTGSKPIINPTANLSNWSVYSGSIYIANVTGNITQIFVDGVFYNLSFHPNTGFFDTENHDGKYGLIDVNLTLTEDQVVNSTVKVMTANWVIEERVVSKYNETIKTMNWTSLTAYDIRDGYGYYLENKLWMLDSPGEWWYNSSSNQIYIWLQENENPNSHTVEVPNQTRAIYAENKIYIHIANLTIKQAENDSLYFENVDYSKISNLNINDSGKRFIYIHNSRNITLENINAHRTRRDGFVLYQNENMTIINNSLYNLGTVGNPVQSYAGVWLEWVNNTLFQYNYLYDIGYIGIRVEGKENIINKNIVNRTCVNLDDCAGIYSQLSNAFVNTFSNNIIVDSIGSPPMKNASIDNEAAGIYLDDSSSEFFIINNTVINADRGIFVHNSFNNTIVNNTLYNARTGAIYFREDSAVGIHNNNISGNIFYTNSTTLPTATFLGLLNSTDFGSFDYNYYMHPYFDDLIIRFYNGTTRWTYFYYYPLYSWKEEKGNDNHSSDMDDFYKINDSNLGSSNYGTEKITNSNFSSGISAWAQYPATYEKSWVSDCPIGNGGCLLVVHNDSDSTTHSIYSSSFPLVEGQEYEIRFKIRGNTTFSVLPEIQRNAVPYDNLGYINYRLILSNETQEVYKIFTATESAAGRLSISFYENATQFWIDDVHVREVNNVRYNNKSDDFLFLYNTRTTSQVYKLNSNYMDLYGNPVSNSITLEPYSSVLLLAGYCNYDYACNNLETSSTCPSDCGAATEEVEVTPGAGGGGCDYDWVCSEWYPSPCPSDGIQKRVCVNRGECAGTFGIPDLNRTCVPYLIEPAEPLFDIFLNIPAKSKWILRGDNASFDVRLLNVGNKTTIDVSFEYLIADENKKLIAEKKETRAVGEEDEFKVEIPLPENLQEGVYKIYVQIVYDDGKVATAGDSFEIVKDNYTIFLRRAIALLPTLSIPLLVILVLVLLLILVRRSHQLKHLRKHKKRKEEKRERKIKKKKKKEYAKKYKKEKRKTEREMRRGKRKAKRLRLLKIKHKEKRKIKPKAGKKKKRNVEVLKPSLSEEFIEKRKILERKHRQKKIKELKKEIKQRK